MRDFGFVSSTSWVIQLIDQTREKAIYETLKATRNRDGCTREQQSLVNVNNVEARTKCQYNSLRHSLMHSRAQSAELH